MTSSNIHTFYQRDLKLQFIEARCSLSYPPCAYTQSPSLPTSLTILCSVICGLLLRMPLKLAQTSPVSWRVVIRHEFQKSGMCGNAYSVDLTGVLKFWDQILIILLVVWARKSWSIPTCNRQPYPSLLGGCCYQGRKQTAYVWVPIVPHILAEAC